MEVVQQVLAVVFVFCLLGLTFWVGRGRISGRLFTLRGRSAGPRALESIDRLKLTPQHSLHLVRLSGKEVLVATHPQGCTVVSEPANRGGA